MSERDEEAVRRLRQRLASPQRRPPREVADLFWLIAGEIEPDAVYTEIDPAHEPKWCKVWAVVGDALIMVRHDENGTESEALPLDVASVGGQLIATAEPSWGTPAKAAYSAILRRPGGETIKLELPGNELLTQYGYRESAARFAAVLRSRITGHLLTDSDDRTE